MAGKLTCPRIKKVEEVVLSLLDTGERLAFRLLLLVVFGYEAVHFLRMLFKG
jgi:hypothetical protein